MRPHYAEYVKHAVRAYIVAEANYDPRRVVVSSRAEQDNWLCCRRALMICFVFMVMPPSW